MPNGTTTTLVTSAGEADAIELWPVYAEVFGDRDHAAWQRTVWDRHVAREGFRLARAYDDAGMAGFAYGYTGGPASGGPTGWRRCGRPSWR